MKMTMLLHVLKIKKNQITTTNNENYIITFLNHPQLLLLLLPLYYYTTILLNDYTIVNTILLFNEWINEILTTTVSTTIIEWFSQCQIITG